jgi:hypothetical protein
MQLSDLLNLCTNAFRPPPPIRTAERKLLVIPLYESLDQPKMKPVIAAAAEQMATSGLVFRWQSPNGTVHLVWWSNSQKVFLRESIEGWCLFIGRNWITKDSNGREYLGPAFAVCDRLIAATLKHPAIPEASFLIQLQRKREAIR